MTTRGLPGFLRRSLRRDDFYTTSEDEDENSNDEYGYEDGDNSIQDEGAATESNNSSTTETNKAQETEESPALEERSDNPNENDNDENDDQISMSSLGDSESGKDAIHFQSSSRLGDSSRRSSKRFSTTKSYREIQFEKVLGTHDDANTNHVVKMSEFRKIAWNGVPPQFRGTCWKILLGYLPTNAMRRQQTLERKRAEYKDAIQQHYYIDDNSRTIQEQETLRQVLVDVPRTAPDVPLFRNEKIKRALSRLLYIWAMRHPASSYVQGINDLATPLFAVFLADDYEGEDVLDGKVMVVLEEDRLDEVEADVYWCLTNILAGIQDHYTADQPGVQRMVMRLQELVNRIDADLYNHIHSVGIQFMQFAFKWMNCLLLREFNLQCVIRLWDTYISEESGNGFEDFHVYVCAAFLSQFSSQLQQMDFDELFQFMQQVPTEDWGETEIEMLLSHAYVLSTLFGGSDAHLASNNNNAAAGPPMM
eukprot:CAMPEP_0116148794 /NCGR_PEP_ID=MMETSP0329-20121206/18572_1 /TAXON_ID=697910 /ORGANISM="Pseudo-nitzschia arenysensis, Strain B593" /LENGTH=477 /DNA_ID=CAMNT_0003645001 /DNA_START=215 /DNA_END=1648 /DNA_ORIENTATION=+